MSIDTMFICGVMWLIAALSVHELKQNKYSRVDAKMFVASLMFFLYAAIIQVTK
jgi:hypothetical protein